MALRARTTAALAMLAAITAACSAANPPPLSDGPMPEAGISDAVKFGETYVPACNAGDLGVCACTELDAFSDAPNLYFILDRSGSMGDENKWTTVRIVTAQVAKSLGPRANFGAAMFPDPTSSDSCAPGKQVMSVRPGDFPAGTQGPTTSLLLSVTSAGPGGGTPTAATLTSLLPTLRSLTGKTFVILATDGGPNCDPLANCDASMCIDNIEDDTGCVAPTNCCDPSIFGPLDCLDEQPTISAVKAIAAAGISTYVIGVPGSGPYASLLDQLATAGGTARATEPLYYAVDSTDQSDFQAALSQIAAKITGSCTITLSALPPDPTHVNVYFDNVAVPEDPTNGWTLSGSTVTLVGAACSEVMSGAVLNVRVVAGCPTLQPN
jgi:hypothetical protein